MSRRWSSLTLESNSTTTPLGGVTVPAGTPFRSSSFTPMVQATSVTIIRPPGLLVDDVMIAQINGSSAAVVTPPPGWTLIISTSEPVTTVFQNLYWKRAVVSEPASYTFSFDVAPPENRIRTISSITAYFNIATVGNPIDTSAGAFNVVSFTQIAPSIATSSANTVRTVHYFQLSNIAGTWTQDAAITERLDERIPQGFISTSEGDERFTTSGAKPARTATMSSAALASIGQTVALIMATSPPISVIGVSEDVSDFKGIRLFSFADQDSVDAGVEVRWSIDGINFDTIDRFQDQFTAHANKALSEIVPIRARFISVKYTNGPVAQTTFQMQTIATVESNNANHPQAQRNVLDMAPTTYLQGSALGSIIPSSLTVTKLGEAEKNHYVTALSITTSTVQFPSLPFRITDGVTDYYFGYVGGVGSELTDPIRIATGQPVSIIVARPLLPTQEIRVSAHVVTLPVSLTPVTP